REGNGQHCHHGAAQCQARMPPERFPQGYPPPVFDRLGLLPLNARLDPGPERRPVRICRLSDCRLHQAPEIDLVLDEMETIRTMLQMDLDRSRRPRAKGTIGVTLESRPVPETGGFQHGSYSTRIIRRAPRFGYSSPKP